MLECEKVVEEKREFRILANQVDKFKDKYKKQVTEAKRILRITKRQHLDKIISEMKMLLRT